MLGGGNIGHHKCVLVHRYLDLDRLLQVAVLPRWGEGGELGVRHGIYVRTILGVSTAITFHRWPPPCSCPPAAPSDQWYGGLGVLLVESEAWKPQKVGGCGWTRCPRNSILSRVAQDTARSWFWACLTQTAHIQAIFSHFLGRFSDISWS